MNGGSTSGSHKMHSPAKRECHEAPCNSSSAAIDRRRRSHNDLPALSLKRSKTLRRDPAAGAQMR